MSHRICIQPIGRHRRLLFGVVCIIGDLYWEYGEAEMMTFDVTIGDADYQLPGCILR